MNFKFPSIIGGYVGSIHNPSTLAAKLNSYLLDMNQRKIPINFYPQRIPRPEFFEELFQYEDSLVKKTFNSINIKLLNSLNENIEKNGKALSVEIVSLMHILMRRNCVKSLYEILKNYIFKSDEYEARYIWENIKFELSLYQATSIQMNEYHSLAKEIVGLGAGFSELGLQIANRLIVCSKRHSQLQDESELLTYYQYCLGGLTEVDFVDFKGCLLASKCYRGIAMITHYGKDIQSQHLEMALQYAIKLQPENNYEELIAKENMYTLLQTLGKWYSAMGLHEKSEMSLREMCALDPNDSTAFSELGFFLGKHHRFDEALTCFSEAFKLGPPAVGMNKYFTIKMKEKLGHAKKSFIDEYYDVIEHDPYSISPFIELFQYYNETAQINYAKLIAKRVLDEKELSQQLSQDELNELTGLAAGVLEFD